MSDPNKPQVAAPTSAVSTNLGTASAPELRRLLVERMKELNCLQQLGKIVDEAGQDRDELLERAVAILPPSWLHDQDAVGQIQLDEQVWQTDAIERCAAVLEAPLAVDGVFRGRIAVGYRSEQPPAQEGPFLAEERALIDALAARIGHHLERIEAAETLDRERDTLRAVFDGIDDVVYVADPETYELLYVNATFERTWGTGNVGKKCFRVIQGRDEPCPFCTNEIIFGLEPGEAHVWEFQNGLTETWFRCTDRAIRWVDGRRVRFELAADVTALKTAEQSSEAERAKLATFLDNTRDLVTIVDAQGRYTYVNEIAEQILGATPEDLIGRSAFEDIHPDDRDTTQQAFGGWLAERATHASWENRLLCADGSARRMLWTIMPKWVDGELDSIWSIARDVTDRWELEQQLRRHRDDLEALVQERTAALEQQSAVTAAINRVLRDAITLDSEEAVAQAALRHAQALTGAAFGFIGEVNAQGRFDTIGLSNPGWDACALPESNAALLIRGMELSGIWASVIKQGRSLIVNDPPAHPESVGIPEGHPPLESFLGVPLERGNRTIGMIALVNRPGGFGEREQAAVEKLSAAFHEALLRKRMELQLALQARLEAAQVELARAMQGDQPLSALGRCIIDEICTRLDVPMGALWVVQPDGSCVYAAGHAYDPGDAAERSIPAGVGLVGQVALDQRPRELKDLPSGYLPIRSGLGSAQPGLVRIEPIVVEDRTVAVVELAAFGALDSTAGPYLEQASAPIAAAIRSAQARTRQAELLEESQRLTEELRVQQEELQATNEELQQQTQQLTASQARLQTQQEELEVTNAALEEKSELLKRQKREVEQSRKELAAKAQDLERTGRYKSDFLATMSHELRTPLNSLLLLARSLADNRHGNLGEDEVESARIIHRSGSDLLQLINEILDLSRIEAGRVELRPASLELADLASRLEASFAPLAAEKGLELEVERSPDAPERITTDPGRLEQVLRNLVGNAIKFTQRGSVRVALREGRADDGTQRADLHPDAVVVFEIADTGIGISVEQQAKIFEAFEQLHSGTARPYEGTGLGLSISRELVRLLGGEIRLESEPGVGSTFSLVLPRCLVLPERSIPAAGPPPRSAARLESRRRPEVPGGAGSRVEIILDDRDEIGAGERPMLIVEDDARFAHILANACRDRDLKVLVAGTAEEGLQLAHRYPLLGILLDLALPGMDGLTMLERLKGSPKTRHIPVHIVSGAEPNPQALRQGAIGYVQKPLDHDQLQAILGRIEDAAAPGPRRLLVVEDDAATRRGLVALLEEDDIEIHTATSGQEALAQLAQHRYHCMILDLGLRDMDGAELLRQLEGSPEITSPPVVVYTGRELTWQEDLELRSYSEAVIVKGVRSEERLIDEVALFLHRVVADLPSRKRQIITDLHDGDAMLRDRTVLLVDDDMRALFALTRLLSDRGMRVLKAPNGMKALELLDGQTGVDVVLMDIMMPEMDGYETMERIRAQQRFEHLPIIALTAKAMQGDKERCLEAGANDYLPKPVDQDRLLSLLRIWLYR